MAVIHIPEEEAVRDFGAVLSKIDSGAQVIIDRANGHVTVLRTDAAVPLRPDDILAERLPRGRTGAEMLEILANLPGERSVMDEDFAADIQFAMDRLRTLPRTSPWD